jgi:hypothetical protein
VLNAHDRRLAEVSLRCFPRDDPAFAAAVEQALKVAFRLGMRGLDEIAAEVAALIRPAFPASTVRVQLDLASIGGERILYCFRDGAVGAAGEGSAEP